MVAAFVHRLRDWWGQRPGYGESKGGPLGPVLMLRACPRRPLGANQDSLPGKVQVLNLKGPSPGNPLRTRETQAAGHFGSKGVNLGYRGAGTGAQTAPFQVCIFLMLSLSTVLTHALSGPSGAVLSEGNWKSGATSLEDLPALS